jgi:hypothetical protein
MNWVLISQKTTFFIVTAMKTSNLTKNIVDLILIVMLHEFCAVDSYMS